MSHLTISRKCYPFPKNPQSSVAFVRRRPSSVQSKHMIRCLMKYWQPQDICSLVAATDKCTVQHQANISIMFANKRKSTYHP